MTPDEAKLILSTYRPGESAPDEADARAALELAAANPELAAWWAAEQAFDRVYARKLAAVTPPMELATTIMRGGATIFFARRLIAESTGEKPEEPPMPVELPASENMALPLADSVAKTRLRRQRTWLWSVLPVSLAASVAMVLFVMFLLVNTQSLFAKSNQELPDFRHYAAALADGGLPPQQSGQSLDELHGFLEANQAPNPAVLPERLGQVSLIGVGVETWRVHHVAYYILQSGDAPIRLFVLNRAEFPHDEVATMPSENTEGLFLISTWGEGPHVFILLREHTPAAP